jgi:hypothetical protein
LLRAGVYLGPLQVDYILNTADKTLAGGKKTVEESLSGVKSLHETNVKTFKVGLAEGGSAASEAAEGGLWWRVRMSCMCCSF